MFKKLMVFKLKINLFRSRACYLRYHVQFFDVQGPLGLLQKKKKIIYFVERREGREKEGERHQSVVSCTLPNRGLNPQPRHIAWNQTGDFHFAGQGPTS